MTDFTLGASASIKRPTTANAFYFAAWRWHFYAGLFVIPFMIMLSVTGLIMVYFNSIETKFGEKIYAATAGEPLAIIAQANAAASALPGGTLKQYIVSREPGRASQFRVDLDDKAHIVTVDPVTGKVLDNVIKNDSWFYFASDIHGTLLIGDTGDRLIEISAGFGIMLIATGLYLWWPRKGKMLRAALVPNLKARRRLWWKELHSAVGYVIAVVLFFFLLSGMAWTGVWGGKLVQAWSTFPAEKWDNVPLSDKTYASMNQGALHEVPWALELANMPVSGSDAGVTGIKQGVPVNLNTIVAFARENGFASGFRVNLPEGETGVYTISADSMDGDTTNPMGDRTVHIDQYTGKVLATVNYADYSLAGKSMAVGIALHQGDLGWWNSALNALFCLAVIFLSVSGLVMWWMRRPSGSFRLAAPPVPADLPTWKGAVFVMLLICLVFPLVGLSMLAVLLFDLVVLSTVKPLKHFFA
jgi:uncharacterized iron-regulated membrane protein